MLKPIFTQEQVDQIHYLITTQDPEFVEMFATAGIRAAAECNATLLLDHQQGPVRPADIKERAVEYGRDTINDFFGSYKTRIEETTFTLTYTVTPTVHFGG